MSCVVSFLSTSSIISLPLFKKNKDLSVRAEPLAFAMVSGVKDVVTAVKFCAEHGIAVTVRGKGAHSPWGMAQVRAHKRRLVHDKVGKRTKIFSILTGLSRTMYLL